MTNFKYISAPAGAGKTTKAISYAERVNTNGFNVLFVVPTIKLADQIANSSTSIQAIHSNNTEKGATAQTILAAIESADGSSIVITEESFKRISVWHNKDNWIVIKDEAHEPLSIHDVSVADSIDTINDRLKFKSINESALSTVTVIDNKLKDTTDFVFGNLKQMIDTINDNSFEVLVDTQYLEYTSPRLVYSIFELPNMYKGFQQVIFMSANFEHTFLYHQWAAKGVNWINITDSWKLPSIIPNTDRVKIHYFTEDDRGWSANKRSKLLNDYVQWVNAKLKDRDYIYVKNNNDIANFSGKQMPAVCHGLNDHRDATCFVSASSYLINKKFNAFYDHYDTSINDARSLRNTQMLFQQLMRCDLRNYESKKSIDLYVPTSVEAVELLQYIPNACIIDFNKKTSGGQTTYIARLHNNWTSQFNQTSQERPLDTNAFVYNYNYKDREVKVVQLAPRKSTPIITVIIPPDLRGANSSTDLMTDIITTSQRYQDTHAIVKAIKVMQKTTTISIAKATSKEEINQLKTQNTWFSNAIITEGKSFKNENVKGVHNFLAFDFDNSILEMSDLKKCIFNGFEFLYYTSISHGQSYKTGSCFRVIVPCTRVMSVEEHARLMNYFEERINKFKNHGFDAVSKKVVQKWFFPHAESDVKYIKTGTGTKQATRSVLDVDCTLAYLPKKPHVIVPTLSDLRITNTATSTDISVNDSILIKIDTIINSMTAGDRSYKATQIGGMLGKYVSDRTVKDNVINKLKIAQVGETALKSVKKYAKL